MVQWADFPWEYALFADADEAVLTRSVASVENATANRAGGMSRFPGLVRFASFPGERVYLRAWNDDLYAATDAGKLWRIDRNGNASDVTGVPISGGKRVIMEAADDRLLMAAGGPIIQLIGKRTELLSRDAPDTSHIAYVDAYLIAIERWTSRFQFCQPGEFTTWNPIDVFSANAKPDPITAVVVTPYRELLLAGAEHIEQFERLPNGIQPFTRRWSTGEGVAFPYTLVSDKSGTYGMNPRNEFVQFAGQVSQDRGEAVGLVLSQVDDWTDAWASSLTVSGAPHIVLQAPFASNVHGTAGVTLLLDLRNKRWSYLYGFDAARGMPARYPVWSFGQCWGRTFAGVDGGIAEISVSAFDAMGEPTPFLIRSAHVSKFGPSRIDDVRIRLKRGVGAASGRAPKVALRVNRDNLGFDQWQWEPMGTEGQNEMVIRFGGQGCADTWQFELRVSDPVDVQFVNMQIYVERLRW